jgi:hypothetical protein
MIAFNMNEHTIKPDITAYELARISLCVNGQANFKDLPEECRRHFREIDIPDPKRMTRWSKWIRLVTRAR